MFNVKDVPSVDKRRRLDQKKKMDKDAVADKKKRRDGNDDFVKFQALKQKD